MTRVRLKYVTADRDRHGKVRYYFRKRALASKTRIPGVPGSKEFMAAYEALLDGQPLPEAPSNKPTKVRAPATSLRWLFHQYLANPVIIRELDPETLSNRRRILGKIADEPISPGNPMKFGEGPFAEITSKAIRRLLERKANTPAASNDWLKTLKAAFKWAVKQEYTTNNPVRDIEKMRLVSEGFHTWTLEEVAQYEAKHPVGSTQRLALGLLLYTGQRKSDVILFGPQHVKDGWLRFTQQKNRNRKPVTLDIPILPELAEILSATPTGHLTYLVSKLGKGFTRAGFGVRFRKWCDAAGLPKCTAHGLRKAGATRAAENGATASQLMAIFGWSDIKQAELYTRAADQKRIAGSSMHLLQGRDKD
jgi:integrase